MHGGKKMTRILCTLFLTLALFSTSGCALLEKATTNVGGWDVSACVKGHEVCWELFWDNSDKFEGDFIAAISGLGPQTGTK